jgi:hypothetical protein
MLANYLPCRSWILMYLASRMEIHASNNDAPVFLSRKYLENYYTPLNIRKTIWRMRDEGLLIVDENNIFQNKKSLEKLQNFSFRMNGTPKILKV